jgi:hypothetical protein
MNSKRISTNTEAKPRKAYITKESKWNEDSKRCEREA